MADQNPAQYEEIIRMLKVQIKELNTTLRKQQDETVELNELIENLSNKNMKLEDRLKKAEHEIAELEEMHSMNEEMVETQKEIEREIREELDQAYVQINELNKHICMQEKRAKKHEEAIRIAKQQEEASGLHEVIEDLTNKNMELEDRLVKAEQEIVELEEMRFTDEEMLDTQKEIEREIRQELDQAYVQISELNQLISTFEQRASEYENAINVLKSRIEESNESMKILQERESTPILEQYDKKMVEAQEKTQELRSELIRAHKEKDNAIQEQTRLQRELDQLQNKVQQANEIQTRFLTQTDALKNTKEIVAKQEAEIFELKKMNKIRTEEIANLKIRINMMEKRLEDHSKNGSSQAEQFLTKYNALFNELQQKQDEYEKRIYMLDELLKAKESEIEEYKCRLKHCEKYSLTLPNSMPTNPLDRLKYTMKKWKKQIETDKKTFGHILNS